MSESIKAQLQSDVTRALRAGDRFTRLVLSTTLAELRNREIELRGEAPEAEVEAVLARAIKRRREAADQMRTSRPDIAEREEQEAELLQRYLPPQLPEEEVREMIRGLVAEGVSQPGPLMGRLAPKIRGRFDGKEANRLIREILGA